MAAMPVASDTSTPAPKTAAAPRQEPSLHATGRSPLPASIAGAFAAAQYSLQHSLDQAPESEDTGLLPQLYASRIGPRAQAYYLAQFKRFDALDRSMPSWNMAAAFFTLAWCCLRRDFRRFKLEAMRQVATSDESFRPRRVALLREFHRILRGG